MKKYKTSWKDQKIYICELIKQLSDHYGGDEIIWLRDYAKEVVEQNKDGLESAIVCFEDLDRQTRKCQWKANQSN